MITRELNTTTSNFKSYVVKSNYPQSMSQLISPIDLEEEMREEGRFYKTPAGVWYPSVTTVLKKMSKEGLDAWKERVGEDAANAKRIKGARRGSMLHKLCEDYVINGEVELIKEIPVAKKLFKQLVDEIDGKLSDVRGIEIPVYSDLLGTAGRSDLVASWEGVPSIIDYKSSHKRKKIEYLLSYFYQLTAYGQMVKETYDIDVEQIVVVIGVEDSNVPQIVKRPISQFADEVRQFFRENRFAG